MKKRIIIIIVVVIILTLTACSSQQGNESPLLGTNAPDFILDNAAGGQVSLSDYHGQPVLLFFHMAVG